MKANLVSDEAIAAAVPHIKDAVAHLVRCWDALRSAERILDIEISIDQLEYFASGLHEAASAHDNNARSNACEWLRTLANQD